MPELRTIDEAPRIGHAWTHGMARAIRRGASKKRRSPRTHRKRTAPAQSPPQDRVAAVVFAQFHHDPAATDSRTLRAVNAHSDARRPLSGCIGPKWARTCGEDHRCRRAQVFTSTVALTALFLQRGTVRAQAVARTPRKNAKPGRLAPGFVVDASHTLRWTFEPRR